MTDETVRFSVLCSMFQAMLRDRTSAKKRRHLRTFLDKVYTGNHRYFAAVRLILPSLDRERGTYGLRESSLALCLVDAMGIARDSEDALRLVNWRKGGPRTGASAGNFVLVASEVLQRRQGMASGGMTIKQVNNALDELASKENKGDKSSILSDLIKRTNAVEMKWIIMIILKDLKLGISEKSIFHEFHPDAEDLFNVTCDLKLVCEKLKDRSQRHKRQDIEVGKAVRPQLAMRVSDAATAWKKEIKVVAKNISPCYTVPTAKLHGRQVVIECKFDGDRIQIHKDGTDIHYFSRNFLDHSEYAPGMSDVIVNNVSADRCILDGEMLVWDTSTNRFAEFGSNQEIAKVAREGLESDRQLCYVAFDILYVGDTSVIHQSLAERHELLQKVVKPVKGRFEILVPNDGLNERRSQGEPCWSMIVQNLEDVDSFFRQTIKNRDEGVVLKDLSSKWEPSDRSGKWLKLKPDYIHAGVDLDALIIGGYFGSGRRGGEVAQFLMGLAVPSDNDSYPKRFISFCRVGSGLSDDELDSVVAKLKPYFRKNEYPKKAPRFLEVTNNSKERPDVWIEKPNESVILSITSDIRTIKSEVFAVPYGLRFPRIERVRYDKPWHECLDVQSFVDLVHQSNGNTQKVTYPNGSKDQISGAKAPRGKGAKKNLTTVPTHLTRTDVSGIKEESYIFTNMMLYFANIPPSYSLDYFHKLVAENGGTFSMNLNDSVTHCIAAEKRGIKYQAATRHGDVIHYSWFLDCCAKNCLLHLQPKYFLFLSATSRNKFKEEMDDFSDYYFWDLDINDIKQIFSSMDASNDLKAIKYYKKACNEKKWCTFQDCRMHFAELATAVDTDWKVTSELMLRRLKIESAVRGGEIVTNISVSPPTHVVSFFMSESIGVFQAIYESYPASQRHILLEKMVHIVSHQWLEDSAADGKKLLEDAYSLRPDTFVDFKIEPRPKIPEARVIGNYQEMLETPTSPGINIKRKRGRPSNGNPRKEISVVKPARRTRARVSKKHAIVDPEESEGKASFDKDFQLRKGCDDEDQCEGTREPKLSGNLGHMDETRSTDFIRVPFDVGKHRPEPAAHAIAEADSSLVPEDGRKREEGDGISTVDEPRKGIPEKLEIETDPVHAILLDMVPSLIQKKDETGVSYCSSVNPESGSSAKPEPGLSAKPAAKRKVSYKDVADKLLNDG